MDKPDVCGLSVHDERTLLRKAQGDGATARYAKNQLLKEFRRLVQDIVNKELARFQGSRVPPGMSDDLLQEGLIAFLEAVRRFDLSRSTRLSTYAWKTVAGQLKNYLRSGRSHRQVVSIEDLPNMMGNSHLLPEEIVGDKIDHPEHMRHLIDDKRKTRIVQRALSKLTPKQRKVVKLHYWEDMRQVVIAERMGVSRPAISQLLRRALNRLESILSVQE
jgi:RNA polymerase sporulation-specific sigma factor